MVAAEAGRGSRAPAEKRDPPREKRDPPRERIVEAAATLFDRHGVRAIGVDRIIAVAGVAKASFYRHFASKDALVVEWLRSERARWLDPVRAETERRAEAPDDRLLVFFDVLSEHVASPDYFGCPYLGVAAELRSDTSAAHEVVIEFVTEVQTYLSSLAAEAGLGSPERLGRELRIVCAGLMTSVVATEDPGSESAAAREGAHRLVDAAR